MATTTIQLSGKKDKATGQEKAWKINARKLTQDKMAAQYPDGPYAEIPGTKKGEKLTVLQVPLYPSNVTAREFSTADDVRAAAGQNFDSWVVRAANQMARDAAEAHARSSAEDIESYSGQTLTFDGSQVDFFTPPAPKAEAAPTSLKGKLGFVISEVGDLSSLSEAERLAALEAAFAELKSLAAKK